MKVNRFHAFAIHLVGSVVVALLSSALVFLVWYPGPLPAATGVTAIFLLLLAVDVVIGPCITLVVFNPVKKELKRDMVIVLLLQLGALFYGLNAVFVARPVYYVFNVDRFDLVYANDLTPEKLTKVTDAEFQSVPSLGPKFIAARRPEDVKEKNEIMFGAVLGGDDVPQLPQYYVRYAELQPKAQGRVLALEELRSFNKEQASEIDALVTKYHATKGGIGFLPLRGKVADLTVIVGKDTAEVLEVTDLKPWP